VVKSSSYVQANSCSHYPKPCGDTEMDMTHKHVENSLKYAYACMSGHVSHTTRLHDISVHVTQPRGHLGTLPKIQVTYLSWPVALGRFQVWCRRKKSMFM